jgi:intein/homing endonuclease
VKKNLSEAIVTHTYTYDTATDNGVYKPILTIQTKNGRQISISPDTNIIVKRTAQTLDIIVESNPGQVANVGDRVTFSLS